MPLCNGKYANQTNSLATVYPNLAVEWNYNKNGDITPLIIKCSSFRKVWWICNKGHEWQSPISSRIKGEGCPFCSK